MCSKGSWEVIYSILLPWDKITKPVSCLQIILNHPYCWKCKFKSPWLPFKPSKPCLIHCGVEQIILSSFRVFFFKFVYTVSCRLSAPLPLSAVVVPFSRFLFPLCPFQVVQLHLGERCSAVGTDREGFVMPGSSRWAAGCLSHSTTWLFNLPDYLFLLFALWSVKTLLLFLQNCCGASCLLFCI